jgi:hypothetical protein
MRENSDQVDHQERTDVMVWTEKLVTPVCLENLVTRELKDQSDLQVPTEMLDTKD